MVLNIILIVLNIPVALYSAYFLILVIVGLFRKKPAYADTDVRKHFAILIPARNEESVIGTLMESIQNLDYPKDCYDTYVMLHNCTDGTEEIVKQYGARIIRRGPEMKTKGEVLNSVFEELAPHEEIDAYVIVDADNSMNPEFLLEVNKAVVAGESVIQCRRTGRNIKKSWVADCYEIYYRMQNAFYNRPRVGIRRSASVNGSGWVVTREELQKNGFNVQTITEDMEYTVICALNDTHVAYVREAISSDQFVDHLKLSMTQRVRWTYGMFQCIKAYEGKLFKRAFQGHFEAWDLALVNLMMISTVLSLVMLPLGYFSILKFFPWQTWIPVEPWQFFLIYLGAAFVGYYLGGCVVALLAVILSRGDAHENCRGIHGFPIFLLTWIPVIIYCMFKRRVDWKPMRKSRAQK